MRTRWLVAVGMICVTRASEAAPDDPGPAAEVVAGAPKIDLPAVPVFEVPAIEGGVHDVRELRVAGRPLLGTSLKVKGYVTWVYDCATALAKPGRTSVQIQQAIDANPALCERPKFYLGASRGAAAERSVWVVDVPRPPNKLERERLPKADLAKWPVVPKIAVGDYVVVTGSWVMQSPHAEANSDGLLVFASAEQAKPSAAQAAPIAAAVPTSPALPVLKAPPRKAVDPKVRAASVKHVNTCNKGLVDRNYDDAVAECTAALTAWDGNHLAWWGIVNAHLARGDWAKAKEAVLHAVELKPDQPMYQMMLGLALYESTVQEAREAQAKRAGRKVGQVTADLSAVSFDPAIEALRQAIKLNANLWRAHYYLGRIHRDHGEAKQAAEELTKAIAGNPREANPYVALVELYRRWDYTDQAIAVASQGTANVGGDPADLWYVLGMGYDDKRDDAKAIEAFTNAIKARPDHAKAKFQRGQAYVRQKDFANGKRDLEEFLKSTSVENELAKVQANRMLMDIAAQPASKKP
jgi:tetratricopeptide (TPR) repeat protein